jgi:hypothetical protein
MGPVLARGARGDETGMPRSSLILLPSAWRAAVIMVTPVITAWPDPALSGFAPSAVATQVAARSPTPTAAPSGARIGPSTPAGARTVPGSARPARLPPLGCIWPAVSPARCGASRRCVASALSSRPTRARPRRSCGSPASGWSEPLCALFAEPARRTSAPEVERPEVEIQDSHTAAIGAPVADRATLDHAEA